MTKLKALQAATVDSPNNSTTNAAELENQLNSTKGEVKNLAQQIVTTPPSTSQKVPERGKIGDLPGAKNQKQPTAVAAPTELTPNTKSKDVAIVLAQPTAREKKAEIIALQQRLLQLDDEIDTEAKKLNAEMDAHNKALAALQGEVDIVPKTGDQKQKLQSEIDSLKTKITTLETTHKTALNKLEATQIKPTDAILTPGTPVKPVTEADGKVPIAEADGVAKPVADAQTAKTGRSHLYGAAGIIAAGIGAAAIGIGITVMGANLADSELSASEKYYKKLRDHELKIRKAMVDREEALRKVYEHLAKTLPE